jgi:hypothetical protein
MAEDSALFDNLATPELESLVAAQKALASGIRFACGSARTRSGGGAAREGQFNALS